MDKNAAYSGSGTSRLTFLAASLIFFLGPLLTAEPAAGAGWKEITPATDQHLRGVWIAPDKSAFAVGDLGKILRFNGSALSTMVSGTMNALYDVWGSSVTDVTASGVDQVLLYNGTSWDTILDTGSSGQIYTPVWMPAGGGDIFVGVPMPGSFTHWLYRYDREAEEGQKWGLGAAVGSFMILAFGGGSDTLVFMVMESGDILQTNTNDLPPTTVFSQPEPLYLTTAWFNPSNYNEAFGADELGHIHRFNGSGWTDMSAGITDTTFYGMGGSSGSDVYAVGINDVSGNGVMWHYNGVNWTQVSIPTVPGLIDVAIGSGIAVGEHGRFMISGYVSNVAAMVAIIALLLLTGAVP